MTKQERISIALQEQSESYILENNRLRKEEIDNNVKYDKSVFYYRKNSCSMTYAVDYIKKYYKEIKISKKKLKELMLESEIVKYVGSGTIGYRSNNSFFGVGRSSYDLLDMDSIDLFAVSLLKLED